MVEKECLNASSNLKKYLLKLGEAERDEMTSRNCAVYATW